MKTQEFYVNLKGQGKLFGTIKRAYELNKDRRVISADKLSRWETISLSGSDTGIARDKAHDLHPRKQNWEDPIPVVSKQFKIANIDNGRYSSGCRYTYWSYEPQVSSYGVAHGSRLVARIWDKFYKLSAPKGWKYGRDDLGLYVVRKKETRVAFRWHLTSGAIKGGISVIRKAGLDHEIIQRGLLAEKKESVKQDKSNKRLLKGVTIYISAKDSYQSGNCRAGTDSWIRNNNLKVSKRYTLSVIQRIAKTHSGVTRAIESAIRRTAQEIQQGVCAL